MFTLGREREKHHSHQYVKSLDEAWRIEAVIDAAHDLLEGIKQIEDITPVFVEAFTNGGSGVWEQTGSWLHKLSQERPKIGVLWKHFCEHRSAKVRFRAAAFLGHMPEDVFVACFPALLADVSAEVRSKTASDRFQSKDEKVREALVARLAVETNDSVKKAINFALTYQNRQSQNTRPIAS